MPAGTKAARFEVASDDAAADIDMEVYRIVDGVPQLVETSGSASGVESVTLVDPEPGEYLTAIFPFSDPPGQSSTTFVYRDFRWSRGGRQPHGDPGQRDGHPGATADPDRGLVRPDAGKAYLGWVELRGRFGTFVAIN